MNKIGWCTKTINPIVGCTKVSPACAHCYAEVMARRLAGMGVRGYGEVIADGGWNGKTAFVESELDKPFRWKAPQRIFVCSMGDLFHESVTHDAIAAVMSMVSVIDRHTYLFLTKRPDRMRKELSAWYGHMTNGRYYNNLWLGVTVENQEQAEARIPVLLSTPAAVRFVSVEPMLGWVDLTQLADGELETHYNALTGEFSRNDDGVGSKLDWVICGGETGPGARPMHPDWVRGLRDQCLASGVPFFFKSWGEWAPESALDSSITPSTTHFHRSHRFRDGQEVFRAGKKHTGALLDGREWKEFPEF